jgi:hypothetical protein
MADGPFSTFMLYYNVNLNSTALTTHIAVLCFVGKRLLNYSGQHVLAAARTAFFQDSAEVQPTQEYLSQSIADPVRSLSHFVGHLQRAEVHATGMVSTMGSVKDIQYVTGLL